MILNARDWRWSHLNAIDLFLIGPLAIRNRRFGYRFCHFCLSASFSIFPRHQIQRIIGTEQFQWTVFHLVIGGLEQTTPSRRWLWRWRKRSRRWRRRLCTKSEHNQPPTLPQPNRWTNLKPTLKNFSKRKKHVKIDPVLGQRYVHGQLNSFRKFQWDYQRSN